MQHVILEDHLLNKLQIQNLGLNMRDKSLQHSQKKQKVKREFKLHPWNVLNMWNWITSLLFNQHTHTHTHTPSKTGKAIGLNFTPEMFLICEIELLHCCLTNTHTHTHIHLPKLGKPLIVNPVKFLWTDDILVKIFQYKGETRNNVQGSTDCLKFRKRHSGQSVTVIAKETELIWFIEFPYGCYNMLLYEGVSFSKWCHLYLSSWISGVTGFNCIMLRNIVSRACFLLGNLSVWQSSKSLPVGGALTGRSLPSRRRGSAP